jgi:hypothetical protein
MPISATVTRRNGLPRQQKVAGLQAEEGDCGRRLDGHPPHRAGRAVDAARHVDRDDRQRGRVHRLDQGGELAVDRTRETCAEQRVDHHIRVCEHLGTERLARSRPALGH